jgi:hypothetical protein
VNGAARPGPYGQQCAAKSGRIDLILERRAQSRRPQASSRRGGSAWRRARPAADTLLICGRPMISHINGHKS